LELEAWIVRKEVIPIINTGDDVKNTEISGASVANNIIESQ
ncbi:10720_t:CDS:1, partial [Acaulospora morrowiae]